MTNAPPMTNDQRRAEVRRAFGHLGLVILLSLVIGGAFVISLPSLPSLPVSCFTIIGCAIWWTRSTMSLSFVAICTSAAQVILSLAFFKSPLIVQRPTAIAISG